MSRSARSPPRSPATTRPHGVSSWCCPRPACAVAPPRPAQASAAVDRRPRLLTPAARRMQMPSNKAKVDADAHPERTGVKRISLEGRSVIVAMCVGQLGSLLPHVVVPSVLAAFLIPEWRLSGAQAGLLAGSGAAGYTLTVPVLATLTDRIDARKILIAG